MADDYRGLLSAVGSLNSAIDKGVYMDYEGAKQLLTFVQHNQAAVAKVRARGDRLAQVPQLGDTPAANVYMPYLPTVATDQTQGLLPTLKQLQDRLDAAASNIQKSIDLYQQTDHGHGVSMVHIFNTMMA
ncbi:hypothetical protein [Actinocrispum wychmicini]|uniref:Uncharacterized protein n=1 Tax=Actinocrispum wychmicini TaxID=1213861 RepID=A0A4R2K729_9PSEU|nr:hypothetical protein [Actinocrispum wychmicini]TCO65638.1 hypothetical protein EV192_1011430 [Actinocrispum wychmicini]